MSAITERQVPETRALRWIALALVLLSLWVLSPVLAPLVFAGLMVLVTDSAYERLVVKLRGRRSLAAVIATIVIAIAVFVPLGGAVYLAGVQAVRAGHTLVDSVATSGGVNAFVSQLPPVVRDRLPDADAIVSALVAWAGRIATWAPRAFGSIGWFIVEAFLAVVSTYYLFAQGPTFVEFLRRVSPLRNNQTDALLSEFRNVALGLFRGNLLTALFQGVAAGVGYALFGVGQVFLLAAITTIAAFVPLVGTGLVWAPLVISLFVAHHNGRAIGLLIWCLLVVSYTDNLLRPLLSRGHMALPRLLLFLMLFGGLSAFGPKGLLLGPLIGSLAVTALRMLSRRGSVATDSD